MNTRWWIKDNTYNNLRMMITLYENQDPTDPGFLTPEDWQDEWYKLCKEILNEMDRHAR